MAGDNVHNTRRDGPTTVVGGAYHSPVTENEWRTLAHTSPAAINERNQLALSLLRHRFPQTPDVLAVIYALEGRTLEDLAGGTVDA